MVGANVISLSAIIKLAALNLSQSIVVFIYGKCISRSERRQKKWHTKGAILISNLEKFYQNLFPSFHRKGLWMRCKQINHICRPFSIPFHNKIVTAFACNNHHVLLLAKFQQA